MPREHTTSQSEKYKGAALQDFECILAPLDAGAARRLCGRALPSRPGCVGGRLATPPEYFETETVLPHAEQGATRDMRRAWKQYYLSRVPAPFASQVTNFLRAVCAEGRNNEIDDEDKRATRLDSVTCSVTKDDVSRILEKASSQLLQKEATKKSDDAEATHLSRKLVEATSTAASLISLQQGASQKNVATGSYQNSAWKRIQGPSVGGQNVQKSRVETDVFAASVKIYRSDWVADHEAWRKALLEDPTMRPYDQQLLILDIVHYRCELEHKAEHAMTAAPQEPTSAEPLFRLIHGLPGSGKSQIIKWLRQYFERVWRWEVGIHFMFVAPLNSMAANIEGATLHSFGEIAFTDRRGVTIRGKRNSEDNISSMAVKCNCLRWLFVDEIEAAGCGLLHDLENKTARNAGKQYKYKHGQVLPRMFGGVNVFYFGDFWQLPPTGQIAVMSNPFGSKVLESGDANDVMSMFWRAGLRQSLQPWSHSGQRVLHLSVNKRSGEDTWYSSVLDACRLGDLSDTQYCFLHGFPTNECGSSGTCRQFTGHCENFPSWVKEMAKEPAASWRTSWEKVKSRECEECRQERARRQRVLQCEVYGGLSTDNAQEILSSDRYADSVLITECNKPVCLYSLLRAQDFARHHHEQLLWIQAEDSPPSEHFAHYTRQELEEVKRKWLSPSYHARKTEGILSLLPCAYDMPLRVTSGQSKDSKEYGIHNGSRCRIRGWTLHEADAARLKDNGADQVILKHLPSTLWVEISGDMKKQYPGAPGKNWFPLQPITSTWLLDPSEHIEILRKGFAAVPDFSSTIHVATGRTLKSCIADLGGFADVVSFLASMRGYIAMSRATDAAGILIARPFSPKLFSQGPQPFPTLLLEVLQGRVQEEELTQQCHKLQLGTSQSSEAQERLGMQRMQQTTCM